MRRALSIVEPAVIFAGNVGTWKFIHTPIMDLPKGTKIKFDLLSQGRPFDWEIPDASGSCKKNCIWALLPSGKTLKATSLDEDLSYQFEFVLPQEIKAGEAFTIFMGSPSGGEKNGNRVQTTTQRKRFFHLFIDPKGKGLYKEPEVFCADVRGNDLTTLKIISPSIVIRNKRFDVIVRFEDRFGNLTSRAPEGTMIDLTYENFRENLHWKLFVPETGFITLPNLYFNEAGVYRLKLTNGKTKETFFSPPIKCYHDAQDHLFWGTLHGETQRFDATDNFESCLRHIRDDLSLNFYASSPFESEEQTTKYWKSITQQIIEFNEEERFVAFLGFQWVGSPKEEGARQIIFAKDNKPLLKRKEMKHNSLKKIYKSFHAKDFLSIPSFTMGSGNSFDFKDISPEFERVAEIYNAWGSSENLKKEGNFRPIQAGNKKGFSEEKEGSMQDALNRGARFGFVAGGLDDRGIYANCFDLMQKQYSAGLTAIYAPALSRDALLEALFNRRCYATTGEKIIIEFSIAEQPMGTELTTQARPGLAVNRYIYAYIAGTKKLSKVELIRSGKVYKTYSPEKDELEIQIDDMDPINDFAIKHPDSKNSFTYYYLRVLQEDGHMAWSSPIWIDFIEEKTLKKALLEKPKI